MISNIIQIKSILESLKPEIIWTLPQDWKFGVLTSNYAFIEAKKSKMNPLELSKNIATELENLANIQELPIIIKNIGPYLNLDLKVDFWSDYLLKPETYGIQKVDQSFVIDMFHPNVGKKIHVGHIRSGDLGESLRRLLSLKYKKVVSDNHLGDWGIAFSYTIWGLENLGELNLNFKEINFEDPASIVSDKLYQIYVKVNSLLEERPDIKEICRHNASLLEQLVQNQTLNKKEEVQAKRHYKLYKQIIQVSLVQYQEAENYLNLNQNPKWLEVFNPLLKESDIKRVQNRIGCHQAYSSHQAGKFNLILGESFYIDLIPEYYNFVKLGLAKQEGQAVFIDLEEEKLGRCYLISSEGYSLYHSRDIANRLVYAGIFGFERALSMADNRQIHSFKQVFAVLRRLIDSKLYKDRTFGWLTKKETEKALEILDIQMAEMASFGFMKLPEGAMSTRKGKIFAFSELKKQLENKVREVLKSKNNQENPSLEKIQAISKASLKWMDLHRDREQDIVFDLEQFLKFEGNTGVYQLYTLARINSILSKLAFDTDLELDQQKTLQSKHLNSHELRILKQIFAFPMILELSINNLKPHFICTHLHDLALEINSWYSTNYVISESNLDRKKILGFFCKRLLEHLQKALQLLAIDTLQEI